VTPHYLRFAIALTAASTSAGCYQAHERPIDAGPIDAYVADTPDVGPCVRPLPCRCPTLADPGTCAGVYVMCCPIVGPLPPPNLRG